MHSFEQFDLLPSLQATLVAKGLSKPTEIQSQTIPLLLAGRSVVGVAETGSGKTLSYSLPILHQLKKLENEGSPVKVERQPRAVVMVPTRELGEQVSKVMKLFTHDTRLRVRTVLGGTTMAVAKKSIEGAFEVLVATPGRLKQLMERELIFLSDVRYLVFDEADQMLDAGFLPDANYITAACPENRQLALFSATVSPSVQELMRQLFADAEVIRSKGSHRVVPKLVTENLSVYDGKRFPVLKALLAKEAESGTLIFTNTRAQCDTLSDELNALGIAHVIYRGEMEKLERRRNLKTFREGKVSIMISTDLASRGLDLEYVGRVINYHLPHHQEAYLHRVGRTARAGRSGIVVNFVTPRDARLMAQMNALAPLPKK